MDLLFQEMLADGDYHRDTSVDQDTTDSPVKTFARESWLAHWDDYDRDSESDAPFNDDTAGSPMKIHEQDNSPDSSAESEAANLAHLSEGLSTPSDDTDDEMIELTHYDSHAANVMTESPHHDSNSSMAKSEDSMDNTQSDRDSQRTIVVTPPHAPHQSLLSSTNRQAPFNEGSMPQRMLTYRRTYGETWMEVEDIELPSLCKEYPELSQEIIYHYMKLSTFCASIWLNYDAAEEKFYADDRIELCGKLKISAALRRKLEEWEDTHGRFSRFVFNICTPFQTLGWARLHDDTAEHPGFMVETHPRHKQSTLLRDYFLRMEHEISQELSQTVHRGWSLDEIDHIADRMICRWQDYADNLSDKPGVFIQPIPGFRESTDAVVVQHQALPPPGSLTYGNLLVQHPSPYQSPNPFRSNTTLAPLYRNAWAQQWRDS